MLHIVNKSPAATSALQSCLRTARDGHSVLLIEDAVYAATAVAAAADCGLQQALGRLKVYALLPDLEARGMARRCLPGIETVDYGGFVDLVASHPNCQTWL
ncbi:sulfurtransferase complex subunit TusB [Caenimonas terrae]|uniref:Sulfurtransferase complex subunit TusB n=1 Tax=Caenimonas terrae TaxID=696074 RepID=A0ABW0N805_9BURK